MAYLNDKDVFLEVQRTGKYDGKSAAAYHVFGRRSTLIVNTLQDIGDALSGSVAMFPALAGTETIQAISSSANDDGSPAGTGAQTIKVTYIDLTYAIVTTGDIVLNGVAAVTVVAADMLYFLWAEVTAAGSLGVAAGDITIRTSVPTVMSKIAAGSNRSMDCCFMIPDGYKGYVNIWDFGNVGFSQDFRIRATVNCHDGSLSTVFHEQDGQHSPANTIGSAVLPWLELPARCKIVGSTISSSADAAARADASFHLILIAD